MNITRHPERLEQLAASYALGTLRGGARRRFETLARDHAPVRAAALVWQSRWTGLIELQNEVRPSPAVWMRIENLVRADVQQSALQARRVALRRPAGPWAWMGSLLLWRGAALAGMAALVLVLANNLSLREQFGSQVAELKAQLQSRPSAAYVAVLSDAQAGESMLVTFDPRSSQLSLQRLGNFLEASDRSLQLWALPSTGSPRSLGVLGREQVLHLTVAEADLKTVPLLAISLEPLGGVPGAGGPTGPVLFKGSLISRTI